MALLNLVFGFLVWFPDADAALALDVGRVCGLRFFAGDFVVVVVVDVVVVVVGEGNVNTWRRLRTARLFLSNDSTREETMIEQEACVCGGNLSPTFEFAKSFRNGNRSSFGRMYWLPCK